MNRSPLVFVDDIHVAFSGNTVLKGFSLQLFPGETIILSGPSGCGKSTVLSCIMGFQEVDSGSVFLFGQKVTGESIWRLRRDIAYIPQEPDLGSGTVRQFVQELLSYKANIHLAENFGKLPELLERFNLPEDILSKDISSLSGGEKQRVAIIASLLLERRVYLLDEVTSALDADNRRIVTDYFNARKDISVIAVSHDTANGFEGRVVNINGGKREDRR